MHPGSHAFTPTLKMHIAFNVLCHFEDSLAAFTRDGNGSTSIERTSVQMLKPISPPIGPLYQGINLKLDIDINVETSLMTQVERTWELLTLTVTPGP